jgi:hypothetical protein
MESGATCNARDPNILVSWGATQKSGDATDRVNADVAFSQFCKGIGLINTVKYGCLNECTKSYTIDVSVLGNSLGCLPCSPGCKNCTNIQASSCTSCLPGYLWDAQTSSCQKCFPTCLTCTGSRYN